MGSISGQDFGNNLDAITEIKKAYPTFGGVSVTGNISMRQWFRDKLPQ